MRNAMVVAALNAGRRVAMHSGIIVEFRGFSFQEFMELVVYKAFADISRGAETQCLDYHYKCQAVPLVGPSTLFQFWLDKEVRGVRCQLCR